MLVSYAAPEGLVASIACDKCGSVIALSFPSHLADQVFGSGSKVKGFSNALVLW